MRYRFVFGGPCSNAPSTMLRMVPLPRVAEEERSFRFLPC